MAKTPVTLPQVLAKIAEASESQWYLFQVEPTLDWAAALDGARLRLAPEVALQAPKSSKRLRVQLAQETVNQLMPLKPAKPGSYKLVAQQNVQAMVRIAEATDKLLEADGAAGKAAREEAAADTKRQAMQVRANAEVARRRAETRQRCSIPPLQSVFEGFGLPLEKFSKVLEQDQWDGRGADPFNEGPDSEAEEAQGGEDTVLHLKPFRLDKGQGLTAPLLSWRLSSLGREGQEQLIFRHYVTTSEDKKTKSQLICQCKDAPQMLLYGHRARRTSHTEFRYLLGGQAAGSRRLYICEADLFFVEHLRRFGPRDEEAGSDFEEEVIMEDEPEEFQLSYWEQRNRLTGTFGVAKRQRDAAKANEKAKKRKFMELDEYASTLTERVEALESNLVDVQERSEAIRRRLLPTYDADATIPSKIYQAGLFDIAPQRLIQEEPGLLDEEMAAFLKKVSQEPLRANEVNAHTSKSKLLAAVISARGLGGVAPISMQEANSLAMKCEVLYRLILLYKNGPKFSKGLYKAKTVATITELSGDSALARHWFMTYHTESPDGNAATRVFYGTKLLSGLLVWALHLTPGLSMEFNIGEVEEEFRCAGGQMKKHFENIGCTVTVVVQPQGATVSQQRTTVTLAHPPRMDMEKYQSQNLLSKKKGGRGRGRGRG